MELQKNKPYYPQRVYVKILVEHDEDGTVTPSMIKWKDGHRYEIDKVLDVRRAASEAGSMGVRYTVRIMGHKRHLFYEDTYSETGKPRWFVESEING